MNNTQRTASYLGIYAGAFIPLNFIGLWSMGLERRELEGPLSVIPADGAALAALGLGMITGSAALALRSRRFAAEAHAARREIADLAQADHQLASKGAQAMYFRMWPEKADAIVRESASDCKRLLSELGRSKRSLEAVISKAQAAIQRIRDDGVEQEFLLIDQPGRKASRLGRGQTYGPNCKRRA